MVYFFVLHLFKTYPNKINPLFVSREKKIDDTSNLGWPNYSFGACIMNWRLFPIAENQPNKMRGFRISWNKFCRFREAPQQPAQAEAVSPFRNAYLITTQKSDRRANATDGRTKREILLKPKPKFFLGTASCADEYGFWFIFIYASQKSIISNWSLAGVYWSYIVI
jgi:hypothetical protein